MTFSATVSIPEMMRNTAQQFSEQPAILFADNVITFAGVNARSDAVAAALAEQGVTKGDRIALYCINSAEFAYAYAGIVKAGAVVVPVNLLLKPREIAYVLKDAGVSGLIYHQLMEEGVTAFRSELPDLRFAVCIGESRSSGDDLLFADFMQSSAPLPKPEFDTLNDLAAILYTSGTTGYPKGAMLTHSNLVSNTTSVLAALQLKPGEDRLLVVLPMFHSFAATVGTLTPLLHGVSFAPLPKFDPVAVSEVIASVGATVFLGVPSMYNVLLRLPDEHLKRWATIRYCVSGGAAMPAAIMQQFEARFGVPICEGDGPTECSPVTCVNPIDGIRKPASVGLPIPNVDMEIYDDEGAQLGIDKIGEICVRGPNVMKGYWKLPEATAESFFGEWVRTGDLGYKDGDGYIYIVDRKKDMIIVNGMNVYPRMLEELLYTHPAILEAAVVGEPSDLHGEVPVAYVVLKEGESISAADVRTFCRENLGRHEVPRKVLLTTALPKNAAGKILKRELRKSGELERGIDSRGSE